MSRGSVLTVAVLLLVITLLIHVGFVVRCGDGLSPSADRRCSPHFRSAIFAASFRRTC